MPALSDVHKHLIIQRLATFVSPSAIMKELKETYGITVTIPHIIYYDPHASGSKVGEKWRALHAELRAAFVRDTSAQAIAHKSYRLQELGAMYRKAVDGARPNLVLAKELLEQAAKEMGEAYTNKRILLPGDPLQELAKLLGYTPEQLAAMLAVDGTEGASGAGEMGVTGGAS